ncbi:myo-inositol transporter [Tulasnella sp. 427]|nr:myo-inositol transporter [Tulasnella sp. 427]
MTSNRYDTGVISGALVTIRGDLGPAELSNMQKEMITSSTTLGALLGGLAGGIISDWTGRKWVLGIADIIFIAGAAAQAISHTVSQMVIGRFVIGIGVGLAACIVPLFIGELAPTQQRGRLVTVNVVSITLGQVIAYGIGAAFESVAGGWRWMVGFGAAPAALQFFFLPFLPESPRILLRQGNRYTATRNLAKIYGRASPEEIEQRVRLMEVNVQESIRFTKETTFGQRFASVFLVNENRRALIVACGLQAFQQLCGFNTLMYYSATLFKSIGFNKPTAVGLIISGTNFVFTLFALKYIDIIGRRRIMLLSSPGMIFGLGLASVSFHFLTRKTNGVLVDGTEYPRSWAILVLSSMVFYVGSYATGLGNVPWQQGELFALEVRGIGSSLATATNWTGNLIIGATYLSLIHAITAAGAFAFYAGLCFVGWTFCYLCYPETSGLSLEEVTQIFKDDFGIDAAERLRREKVSPAVMEPAAPSQSTSSVKPVLLRAVKPTVINAEDWDKLSQVLTSPNTFGAVFFPPDSPIGNVAQTVLDDGSIRKRASLDDSPASASALSESHIGFSVAPITQVPRVVANVPRDTIILPTHVLALTEGPQDTPLYLPVHWQTLAVFCNRPPPALFDLEGNNGPPDSIPLVTVNVPFPSGFAALRDYFYSRDPMDIFRSLFPGVPNNPEQEQSSPSSVGFQPRFKKPRQAPLDAGGSVAQKYAAIWTVDEIMFRAKLVYGFYRNAWALLVSDEYVWTAISMMWSVIFHIVELRADSTKLARGGPSSV